MRALRLSKESQSKISSYTCTYICLVTCNASTRLAAASKQSNFATTVEFHHYVPPPLCMLALGKTGEGAYMRDYLHFRVNATGLHDLYDCLIIKAREKK